MRQFIAACLKVARTGESISFECSSRAAAQQLRNTFYKWRSGNVPKNSELFQISLPNAKDNLLVIDPKFHIPAIEIEDEFLAEADSILQAEGGLLPDPEAGSLSEVLDSLSKEDDEKDTP